MDFHALAGISSTDVLIRFIFGGSAVALSAAVSKMAGGRIGGVFAAFPAVFLSAVITTTLGLSHDQAGKAVQAVSQGALIGMGANVVCAIAVASGVRKYGVGKGLIYGIGIWLLVSGAVFSSLTLAGVL